MKKLINKYQLGKIIGTYNKGNTDNRNKVEQATETFMKTSFPLLSYVKDKIQKPQKLKEYPMVENSVMLPELVVTAKRPNLTKKQRAYLTFRRVIFPLSEIFYKKEGGRLIQKYLLGNVVEIDDLPINSGRKNAVPESMKDSPDLVYLDPVQWIEDSLESLLSSEDDDEESDFVYDPKWREYTYTSLPIINKLKMAIRNIVKDGRNNKMEDKDISEYPYDWSVLQDYVQDYRTGEWINKKSDPYLLEKNRMPGWGGDSYYPYDRGVSIYSGEIYIPQEGPRPINNKYRNGGSIKLIPRHLYGNTVITK